MKVKLLLTGFAALAMTGCSMDDVVVNNESTVSEIGFSPYINNVSRAQETTMSNFSKFKVWGTKSRNANTTTEFVTILDGEDVTKTTATVWSYEHTKYWVKDNAYSFTGIGSSTGKAENYYNFTLPTQIAAGEFLGNFHGTLTLDNKAADAKEDIVWACTKVGTVTSNPGEVKFNFKHLLSRVNLKFVCIRNMNDESSIEIKNVRMRSANSGTLEFGNIAATTNSHDFMWSLAATSDLQNTFVTNFNFDSDPDTPGDISLPHNGQVITENKFIIPGQDHLRVAFDVYTSVTGTDFITIVQDVYFNSSLTNAAFQNVTLKPGYSYTLVAYLDDSLDNLGKIVLTVADVEEYTDYLTPIYDAVFNTPNPIETYSNSSTPASTIVSVNELTRTLQPELAYLGSNPNPESGTFEYDKYNYTWTMESKPDLTFGSADNLESGNNLYSVTLNDVTSADDVKVAFYCKGDYSPSGVATTNSGNIPVTLTVTEKENGLVVISQVVYVEIKYTKTGTTTGGSMDGDDNDG